MDDSPKSNPPQSNIDELVKELSRPQNPAPASTPPTQPVPPAGISNVSSVAKPSSVPAPTPSSIPSAPKEYQSSIRTMADDLNKLKAGQQPQGVTIPRKIEPVAPPVKSAPTAVPSTISPKPVQGPTLAPTVKSAPMAPVSNPVPQPSPKTPTGTTTPAPSVIPRPTPPPSVMAPATKTPEIKPDQKNQFYVPPATAGSSGGGNHNLLFIGIAVGVVLLGGLYWYFIIRPTDQIAETPIVTFTSRPSATPSPDVLGGIFHIHENTINLPATGDPTSAFVSAVSGNSSIMSGTFMVTDVINGTSSTSVQSLTVSSLLDRFLINYPPELKSVLGKNYKIMVYAQKESFDTKGHAIPFSTSNVANNRLVMINEIASSSASILQDWEPTMVKSLAGIMAIMPAKNIDPFVTTIYNGTSVRFKNFPYPDHSIDYALVQYKEKTYLVIAGSRESMFGVIDTLQFSATGGK